MTPRTPQCEVFWALMSSSEDSGIPEDSKSPTFPSVGLHPTLGQSGVATTWVRWVRSLYKAAPSAIKVNGTAGPDFQLACFVRQGYPLAPYLFILATNVMGHMMADLRYDMEGLSLPRGSFLRDQTFADDTTLYLRGSPHNMDKAQNVLKLFCQTSRAKINWHKSAAIWASKKERTWTWGEEVGLRWVPKGKGI